MFKRKPKKNIETFTMVLVYVLVHPRLGWFTQAPKPNYAGKTICKQKTLLVLNSNVNPSCSYCFMIYI